MLNLSWLNNAGSKEPTSPSRLGHRPLLRDAEILIMEERKKTVQPKQLRRRARRIADELDKELFESSDEEIPAPKRVHVPGPTGINFYMLLP